ncbi:autotransporter domain-containing protein [Microvirga lupini]|uniref:autotransporter family protein n=1 Tax=Microvirga lupini TaxID=420324 RepID=UPI001AEF16A2
MVCSGTTTDHYWARENTPSSVEVQTGTTMNTSEAAIRVEGNSTVTIADGATVTVTGGNANQAYNAIYAEDDGSTITNNGSISTHQNSVDGLEATGSRNILTNTGRVSTLGASSEAIIARGDSNILRNSGTLETSGSSARGMIAEGNNNTFVNTGVIRTTGAGGEGIRADGGGTTRPAENAMIANSGTIETSGFTADGIRVIGNNGTITNDGTITASGLEGRGIKIEGDGNDVVNRGTVQGLGNDGEGLYVISNAGQTNTIVNHADGRIIGRDDVGLRGRFGSEMIENFGLIRTEVSGGAAIDLGAGDDSLLIGASSDIRGTVRAGTGTDTFKLGGSTNATFDAREIGANAKYRDFERFEKVDTSTWTTRNDNNTAMPWAVREGTLLVTGSMGGSDMTVHRGATLGGTGTVGSIDALPGSILSPGVDGATSRAGVGDIRTLNVRGNVNIAAGTTYRVDLNNRFESDRIVAGGQATIRGGTVEVHAEQATYSPGRWTILTAQRGVTGQFSGVDDLIFFEPLLTKDANNVYLELLPVFPGTDPRPGQDPDNPGNPRPRPVPPLQPETTPPVTILHHENLFRAAILCRLRCSSSDAMGAVPSFVAIDSVPVQDPADASGRGASVAAPASQGTGWGMWGKVLGSYGRTDATPTSAAMERTTGGIVVGVDGGLGTPYRLGVAAGYLATSFDIDAAAASGDIDSFHIGAYGSAAFGAWTLRGGVAYAHHEIDLARGAVAGRFQGGETDSSADSVQVFGEVGYTFLLSERVTLEPFLGLAHVHVSSHDVVENASPFRANGEVASFDTTYSTLGARLVATMPTSAGTVTFKGMLGWRHAFGDVAPEARFTVTGFPTPFLVVGAPIDRDSLVVEAGLNWQVSEKVAVGLMYDGALGRRDQEHTLRGSLSVRF